MSLENDKAVLRNMIAEIHQHAQDTAKPLVMQLAKLEANSAGRVEMKPEPAPQPSDLHDAIMRLRCSVKNCTLTGASAEMSYKQGHRDARHAAAELVAAQQDERDADHHTIMALSRLLAEVTLAIKGPEPEGGRHSYHDVPELVTKMAMELAIFRASVQQDRQDAERLDFVLTNDAFIYQKGEAPIITYQLWTQDEDENYITISGDHVFHNSKRAAVDAAMALAAQKEPKP